MSKTKLQRSRLDSAVLLEVSEDGGHVVRSYAPYTVSWYGPKPPTDIKQGWHEGSERLSAPVL